MTARATPRRPLRELAQRYAAVLHAAWQVRHELAGPGRLAHEAAFLPAAASLQETPAHPAPRRAALAICALFAVALAWSIVGEIDIVAVAPGRIVVSDRSKTVQPLEASVVRRVAVQDGDLVQAGQLLVELDATNAVADQANVQEQWREAASEARRSAALLLALAAGGEPAAERGAPAAEAARLQSEWRDIAARLAKLDAERHHREAERATTQASIAKLDATLPLARQREADVQGLAAQGFMAGHAGQDRTRERIEMERDLATQRARLAEAQAALAESDQTRAAYLAETRRALSEREAQATLKRAQLEQERDKAAQRQRLTRLTAPVAGTVQQVAVHTDGGVVTPAQVLMVVVPQDAEVTAEVVVDNKDIGFVQAGQTARIKLETFPFTRYGTVDATVKRVAADAVTDDKRGAIFPAGLVLAAGSIDVDGKRVKLSPGMNLTAEIRTGRRRVIEYLWSPVRKAVGEAGRER